MLKLLMETNDGGWIEKKVRKVMDALENLQSECPFGGFSEFGVVEPFLLLCLLKKAVDNDKSGDEAVERIRYELEKNDFDPVVPVEEEYDEGFPGESDEQQKEYLRKKAEEAKRRGVLRLHSEDVEKVLGPLSGHFHTSIHVFDRIAWDNVTEYRTTISLKTLDLERDGDKIFATAVMLSYRNSFGEEWSVNPTIAGLAEGILLVDEGERFTDFMCGTCLSTAIILELQEDVRINLSDSNTLCTDYAEIYSRLSGKKCSIERRNAFDEKNFHGLEPADKVFVNPPLGEKLPDILHPIDDVPVKEIAAAAVMKTANILTPGGKAVVVLPSRYLYSTRSDFISLRDYLLKRRLISAVILLPCLSRGSAGPTVLLVLENIPNEDILMVDWSDRDKKSDNYFYYEKKYMELVLRKNARRELEGIITSRKGDGSAIVREGDIKAPDYNLLPSLYVKPEVEPEKRALDEIDREISSVLDDIQNTIRKLKDN